MQQRRSRGGLHLAAFGTGEPMACAVVAMVGPAAACWLRQTCHLLCQTANLCTFLQPLQNNQSRITQNTNNNDTDKHKSPQVRTRHGKQQQHSGTSGRLRRLPLQLRFCRRSKPRTRTGGRACWPRCSRWVCLRFEIRSLNFGFSKPGSFHSTTNTAAGPYPYPAQQHISFQPGPRQKGPSRRVITVQP
jgi:hypothetical protein